MESGEKKMKNNKNAKTTIEKATIAKTKYLETLALLKQGESQKANRCFKEANDCLLAASELHLGMINQDIELTLELICCEDMLATAGLYQSLIGYFNDLHQRTQNEKERSKWKK